MRPMNPTALVRNRYVKPQSVIGSLLFTSTLLDHVFKGKDRDNDRIEESREASDGKENSNKKSLH